MFFNLNIPVIDLVSDEPILEVSEIIPEGAEQLATGDYPTIRVAKPMLVYAVIANALTGGKDQEGLSAAEKLERWELGVRIVAAKRGDRVELDGTDIELINDSIQKMYYTKVYGFIVDLLKNKGEAAG